MLREFSRAQRTVAEGLGTAFLLAAVVGSGIMGERLAGGNAALALLANTIATGAALAALILAFGPISGAHFNPAFSLVDTIRNGLPWQEASAYAFVQCLGGVSGSIVANLMFDLPWYSVSSRARHGWPLVLSEFVATFGLVSVILCCLRMRS